MRARLRAFAAVLCADTVLFLAGAATAQAPAAHPPSSVDQTSAAQPASPQPTAEPPGQRVARLARRLLLANVQRCPKQRWDFGLYAHRDQLPPPAGTTLPTAKAAEPDGFKVLQVWPDSPADRAGLRLGDRLLAANGAEWSGAGFAEVFRKAEQADPAMAQITFRFARDAGVSTVAVTGQRACAVYAVLVPRGRVNASANGTTAFIYSGVEQALPQDDELAAVIAHEIAHVLLGHSAALAGPTANRPNRGQIEQDADALGVRLMLTAGIDPEAAARAIAKIDAKGRGPLSRLLGLYGSYLPTPERQRFLLAQAAAAKAEAATAQPDSARLQP